MNVKKYIQQIIIPGMLKFVVVGVSVILVTVSILTVVNKAQVVNAAPARLPMPQETRQAAAFQKAGEIGDESQIQVMIQTLQQRPQGYVADSAMHALALMGATEAIPVLDQYIEGNLSTSYGSGAPYIVAEAQVVKARLLAEDAG